MFCLVVTLSTARLLHLLYLKRYEVGNSLQIVDLSLVARTKKKLRGLVPLTRHSQRYHIIRKGQILTAGAPD